MRIQLVRHATLRLTMAGSRFLVDPMLSPAGTMDPAPNAASTRRNPLVELPFPAHTLLGCDAVLLTHLHRDHFDHTAAELLAKSRPMLCPPDDAARLEQMGFDEVIPICDGYTWQNVRIERVSGRHGTGEMAEKMGPVSGYVLYAVGEPTLYVVGDSVWCPEVEAALKQYGPDVVVANGGEAQFDTGGPITMGCEDIVTLARHAKGAQVVVVHMEAWNHCGLTRTDLHACLDKARLSDRVFIPTDGQMLRF